jgi:hypothetical protein
MATINRSLNLAIEIPGNGSSIHFHSMPLMRETVRKYHLVLSKVFSQIYQEGLSIIAGPRVAGMMLESVAKETGRGHGANWWDGQDGVQNGLINEIKRLTNVIVMQDGRWVTLQVPTALQQKLISNDDWDEVEGEIVFFMLAYAMPSRTELPGILIGMTEVWGGQTTSLNCTEFAASLQTSTVVANTAIPKSLLPS